MKKHTINITFIDHGDKEELIIDVDGGGAELETAIAHGMRERKEFKEIILRGIEHYFEEQEETHEKNN